MQLIGQATYTTYNLLQISITQVKNSKLIA